MTRLAFVLLLALACCTPAPTSGVVVDKRFTPSHTSFIWIYGKYGGHMQPIHHGDKWHLLIDGDGEQPTAWVCVSMSEHDATAIGARWGRTVGK